MVDLLLESALRTLALGAAVWLGLVLLRVQHPRAQMTAWTVVLIASLAMPVLMDRLTVTIPAAPLRAAAGVPALAGPAAEPAEISPSAVEAPAAVPPAAAAATASRADRVTVLAGRHGLRGFDWRSLVAAVYLAVAAVMLLRLFTGLMLSWRIARAARPLRESWTGGADVRVTDAVTMPVTFGTTILLPAAWAGWDEAKRQAVLSHERSHAVHHDFHVLLLAAFNRAVFWFNPFAWWQLVRMAELAEIISDDAALETVPDRPSYAGILLDLAGGLRQAPAAIAIARACTLGMRVERILAGTAVPARIGWRKRALVAVALAPAVMLSAAAVGTGAATPPADAADVRPHPFDRYAGWYEFNALRALAVARAGDRLVVQETGRLKFEMTPHVDQALVFRDTGLRAGASVTFRPGADGRIAGLVLDEPGARPRRAVRVDAGRAGAIGDAFVRRVATAPGRFQEQTPADGSKDAVLWVLDDLKREAPTYGRMSPPLADRVRQQIAHLRAMITALGAMQSVFFRGVGPGGFDIYGAKFAGGLAEFRILLGAEGIIENMVFRPDGDGSPGDVATCAREQTLKPLHGAAPILLWLYNDSGGDVRVSAVDGQGRGSRELTIGDDRSAPVYTEVGHPWTVTDAAGQCLEIVVPGQSTRHHIIAADARAQAERPALRRTTPMPGSEQALRRYIDGIDRDEPDYAGMTPQVAAATRQDLVLNRAILARFGTLRAISFRGVTVNGGNDIYIAHFANGSAEWRIGLVKEGRIGRIALGPQY
jgi:beta-lactamase regulating signal transducer with metallopeptidase domain